MGNDEDRIEALVRAGPDALIVDSAHGHSKNVMETVREIKRQYPQVDVVAGNVCTSEGAKAMLECGADAVKVGIGPGSICTTRVVAGVGIPQLTAIYNAYKAVGDEIPTIAAGGIAPSGDIAKALAVGARTVMMGSALAGTEECPGERILHQGRTYVIYRGMGSLDAMRHGKGSRERYGVSAETSETRLVPQGVEGMLPFRGSVADVVNQYAGGLKFSLGYLGARTIPELQKHARFWRVRASRRPIPTTSSCRRTPRTTRRPDAKTQNATCSAAMYNPWKMVASVGKSHGGGNIFCVFALNCAV